MEGLYVRGHLVLNLFNNFQSYHPPNGIGHALIVSGCVVMWGSYLKAGSRFAQEFGHRCAHVLSGNPILEGGSEAGVRSILEIGMPRPREDNHLAWWHPLTFK